MNKIKCGMKGCESVFETKEFTSPNARFICKNHERRDVVRFLNRTYTPGRDDADEKIHFQEHQCDKEFDRGTNPQGTNHIPFQGPKHRPGGT